nr:hypothetical protein [Tanacetum cinerariifolium]
MVDFLVDIWLDEGLIASAKPLHDCNQVVPHSPNKDDTDLKRRGDITDKRCNISIKRSALDTTALMDEGSSLSLISLVCSLDALTLS